MDTLTSIRVFRQVVESGSFAAAADRLDFSPAKVSKHVMSVEKRLGVRLLTRNTRTLSLTETGRVYFERCKNILDDLEDTELEVRSLNAAPRGTLRITVPGWFAGQWFADMLAQYRRRYSEIVVDVSFEDRYVDLVAEGFDLALRVTADSPPDGLIARPVRPLTVLVGASRAYLEQHGTPKRPEELANHHFVGIANGDSCAFEVESGRLVVPVRTVVRYRTLVGAANAVAAGMGIAPLPFIYFYDPAFKDVLVPILSEYPLRKPMLYVISTSRKHTPLKIRTFIDHFVAFVAANSPD